MTIMRSPVGETFLETSTMVSCTLMVRRRKSTCLGRSALTPPEHSLDLGENQKLEAVRDSREEALELLGVSVLGLLATTFGSSVSAHGLQVMTLSRTAR